MSNFKNYLSSFKFTTENPNDKNLGICERCDNEKVIENVESLVNTGQLTIESRLQNQERDFLDQKKIDIKEYFDRICIIENKDNSRFKNNDTFYGIRVKNNKSNSSKELYELFYSYLDDKIDDLIKSKDFSIESLMGFEVFEGLEVTSSIDKDDRDYIYFIGYSPASFSIQFSITDSDEIIKRIIEEKQYYFLRDFDEEKQKGLKEYDYTHSKNANLYDNNLEKYGIIKAYKRVNYHQNGPNLDERYEGEHTDSAVVYLKQADIFFPIYLELDYRGSEMSIFDEDYMSKLWNHDGRKHTHGLLQFNVEIKEFDVIVEPEFDELVFLDLGLQKKGGSLIHSSRNTLKTDSGDKFFYTKKSDKFFIYKVFKDGKKELINKDFDITYIDRHIEDEENNTRYIECFGDDKKYTLLYNQKEENFKVNNIENRDFSYFRFYLDDNKNFNISEFNYNKLLEVFCDELGYFSIGKKDILFDEILLEKSEKREKFIEISKLIYEKGDLSSIENNKLSEYIDFLLEVQNENLYNKFNIQNIKSDNFYNDTILNDSLEYIIDYISENKEKDDILKLRKYRFVRYIHTPELISKGVNIYEPITRYYLVENSDNKILKGTVIGGHISGGGVDINDNLFIYSEDGSKYSELLFGRLRDCITSADYIFGNFKINENNEFDLSILSGHNIITAINLLYREFKIKGIDKFFDYKNIKFNISFIKKGQYGEINIKEKYVHNPRTEETKKIEIEIKKDIDGNRIEEDGDKFYGYNKHGRRLYSGIIKDGEYKKLKLNGLDLHDILEINVGENTIKMKQNGNKSILYNPETYELEKDELGHLLVKTPKGIESYCYHFNLQNSGFLSIEWNKDYRFNENGEIADKGKIIN